jgi:hypothetical protein
MKKQTTLMARVWADLSAINVNDHIQKKGNLSYLSWAWAWSTLMSKYPESYYVFQDNRINDDSVMVECVLTIHEGEEVATRTMWLPVMDYKNKAVINPTARDISDTRMRCLVKCMAMFGLGFYIYAGEDIPQSEKPAKSDVITDKELKELVDLCKATGADQAVWANHYGVSQLSDLPAEVYEQMYNALRGHLETAERSAAQEPVAEE